MFTFFDLETTDKTPVTEILTGFFITVDDDFNEVDSLYIESRPELYLESSYHIHGIDGHRAQRFPDKKESFIKIVNYLKKYRDGFFVCHANGDIFGVKGYFDWQVLNMLAFYFGPKFYYRFQQLFFYTKVISTHTMAKKILSLKNYKLNTVADHFNIKLNHHDAKSDTLATMQIFKNLLNHYQDLSKDELYDLGHWSGTLDFNKKTDGFLK